MWVVVAFLILSFLVFFHELGHFLVAKFFGVHVEVFSIGFGKKIFSKTYKGTQYAFSAIPLGGYVKLKGQDDTNPLAFSDDKDSYTSKNPLERIAILLAGPFFNLILAFVIYMGIGLVGEKKVLPVVGEVKSDMPAFSSDLKSGDRILSVNGLKVRTWDELNKIIIHTHQAIHIVFQRHSQELETTIIPKEMEVKNIFGEQVKRSFIGIVAKGEVGVVRYNGLEAIKQAFERTYQASKLILQSVEKIITGVISLNQVGGVISIVDVISQASQNGVVVLLTLVALISVNLGILNLFPIPALDGGQILFNLYELFSRRKISEKSLYYLTIFGWILLIGLMGLGVYNDINRLVFAG